MFVAVLDNDPKIALLKASGVGSLVPGPLLEESKKICRDLYTGFMVSYQCRNKSWLNGQLTLDRLKASTKLNYQTVCGYPPEIMAILSKIQELTIGKIFKAYKLDGAAFDGITNLLGFKLWLRLNKRFSKNSIYSSSENLISRKKASF